MLYHLMLYTSQKRYTWATQNAELEIDVDVTGTLPNINTIPWGPKSHGENLV